MMPKEPLPAIAGGFHVDPGKIDPRVGKALGEQLMEALPERVRQHLSYVIHSVGMAGFCVILARDVEAREAWASAVEASYRAVELDAGAFRMAGSQLILKALAQDPGGRP